MEFVRVRNFKKFQHYKHRKPPWIRLYFDLLSDQDFFRLRGDVKFQIIAFFMLASQCNNKISTDLEWIRTKIQCAETIDLQALLDTGFIEEWKPRASTMLATRKQVAPNSLSDTDKSREEKSREEPPNPPAPSALDVGFEEFWKCYPRKVGKTAARKAWSRIHPQNGTREIIFGAVESQKQSAQWQKDNGQFIPNPATWLNQGRWEDEIEKPLSLDERMKLGEEHWKHVKENR